jgi:hypothetical protein
MRRKSAKPRRRPREAARFPYPALAALVLVVLAVFWPTVHSKFVYDSEEEIQYWAFIHEPSNLLVPLTFRLMTLDVLDFNRPVEVTSFMFDSLVWGRGPFGYHLTNILLHAVVACLVFILVRHILGRAGPGRDPAWRNWAAFLAALIFAIHPLVTEAVCEPCNRKDILAALFGLTALLVAARHRPGWHEGDAARMLLCPFLCLLAIGSKEVGAAYPILLLLYGLLFRRDEPKKFWITISAASAAVVAAFLTARFLLEHHPSVIFLHPPTYPDDNFFDAVFLVQPRLLALYLINIFWPAYLSADYTGYSVRYLQDPLAYAMVIPAAGLLGWFAWRDRRAAFGAGIVVLGLLPVCNLVPIFHPAADRYLYNPLIGLVLLAAIGLDHPALASRPARQAFAVFLVAVVALALLPLTLQREQAWSSPLALWEDTLERTPNSFPMLVNLPEALLEAGRLQEAQIHEEACLDAPYPDWPWAWADYAIIMERLGDHADALKAARRAIALKPTILDAPAMTGTLQVAPDMEDAFVAIAKTLPEQKK